MAVMNNNKDLDLKQLKEIISLTNSEIKDYIIKTMKNLNYRILYSNDYIFCEPRNLTNLSKILLCCHLDSVINNKLNEEDIYYVVDRNVIFSPEGIKGDDRAGVFLCILLAKISIKKPYIVFFDGEESGCIGVKRFIHDIEKLKNNLINNDLKNNTFNKYFRFLIGLDRRGNNEAVFYNCISKDFIKFIESFGFNTNTWGSYTDVSVLMENLKVCGVNLSVGFEHNHTQHEIINLNYLLNTYSKVMKIINMDNIPSFEYEEEKFLYDGFYGGNLHFGVYKVVKNHREDLNKCEYCGKLTSNKPKGKYGLILCNSCDCFNNYAYGGY